ncbi:MAG TPA: acyl-CoA thioesterase [Anaerolineales bacterium]|nr:acyl-CoA thioesterase [Anaerolineales bacterium]
MSEYSGTYEIRFSDIDGNRHVNYAAYVDAAADLRYRFFTEHGFPPERFEELGIAPTYSAIHAQFLREVRMGETVTITFALAGLSAQGGRWKVHHDIFKSNSKKAVTIDLEGLILELATRRAVLPTPELLETFHLIPRIAGFETLPEMRRMR